MALNFPQNPTNGQTYLGYVYSTAVGAWQAKPAAQSPFYTSDTPPANPITGDSWFNTNDGTMYIYTYDGNTYQWVEHRSQIAKSQVGLVPITPTSIAVSSGTATVDVSGNVTFTSVSNLALNGVFTSAYRNYRFIVTANSSTLADLNFRLRVNGTDASGTNYYFGGGYVNDIGGTGTYAGTAQAAASLMLMNSPGSGGTSASVDLQKPAEATFTNGQAVSFGAFRGMTLGFTHGLGAAYDGFILYPSSGNISGNLKVYGYN